MGWVEKQISNVSDSLADIDPGPAIGDAFASIDPGPVIGSGLAEVDKFVNREIPGGWITVAAAAATAGAAAGGAFGGAAAGSAGTAAGGAAGGAAGADVPDLPLKKFTRYSNVFGPKSPSTPSLLEPVVPKTAPCLSINFCCINLILSIVFVAGVACSFNILALL